MLPETFKLVLACMLLYFFLSLSLCVVSVLQILPRAAGQEDETWSPTLMQQLGGNPLPRGQTRPAPMIGSSFPLCFHPFFPPLSLFKLILKST